MDGGAPILDDPSQLIDRIASSLANGAHWQVALVDGHIVGLLATLPEEGVLDQLFVAPAAQGRGIGAALLDQAKLELREGFTLRTPTTNMAAQRFYERHGLRFLKDAAHPVTGAPVRYFEWVA